MRRREAIGKQGLYRPASQNYRMLQYACKTAGFDCDAVFSTKTEEEMTELIGKHATEVHGLEPSDLSPELMRKVKASIQRI